MIGSLSFSPRKMWHWLYGATKSSAISPPICGSTRVKRWQGNIWPLVPRTSGQMNVSTRWTGNTWTSPSRTRQICTKYGSLNNIWAFVVQGSRSAATPVNSSLTRDAQIAEDGRRPPISCFAPMTNAPDSWLRTLMNQQHGCHKTTEQNQRSYIGFPNTFL